LFFSFHPAITPFIVFILISPPSPFAPLSYLLCIPTILVFFFLHSAPLCSSLLSDTFHFQLCSTFLDFLIPFWHPSISFHCSISFILRPAFLCTSRSPFPGSITKLPPLIHLLFLLFFSYSPLQLLLIYFSFFLVIHISSFVFISFPSFVLIYSMSFAYPLFLYHFISCISFICDLSFSIFLLCPYSYFPQFPSWLLILPPTT